MPDQLPNPSEPTEPLHDSDVPFYLPDNNPLDDPDPRLPHFANAVWDADNTADFHNMPTMPLPPETGGKLGDPSKTLMGSGGLDPNPDFQATVAHQPVVIAQSPRTPSHSQVTVSMPAYNPQAQYQPPAAPTLPPAPPTPPPALQQGLPLRGRTKKRGCFGCSRGCIAIAIGFLVMFCGGLSLITVITAVVLGGQLEERLQKQISTGFANHQQFQSSFYYDRQGRLLYEAFDEGRRTAVAYSEFPQALIDATVAIEDDNFFSNIGIDPPATLRAFGQYVGMASGSSGGSTITQQLVRNVLFSYEYRNERSIQRKLEEILLAILLTQRKSKEDILGMYMNEIYYGNLAYGAEAAAQTFFGKHVTELTIGEAAMLAGLPQAPATLDPLNPDPQVQADVYARWNLVLDRMVLMGKITPAQRNDALRQGLTFASSNAQFQAPHFTVYAQNELQNMVADCADANVCPLSQYSPEDIVRGGWKVYTTLDQSINDMALSIAQEQVSRLAANNVSNASVVVMHPLTGEIVAMIGSIGYDSTAIDGRVNVAIALRQPGSTMKPFTYSAAMETGVLTPGDVIWDVPIRIGTTGAEYVPRNYDGGFHGPMIMRRALANSYNIPAVETLRLVGVDYLLQFMRRFGVETLGADASQYGLSLTLGGGEVSLLELTNAYGVFANSGVLVQPTSIRCIIDSQNAVIYEYENGCPTGNRTSATVTRFGFGKQVLDPRISYIITDILSDNRARAAVMGVNSPLNTGNLFTAVKTGTTNDVKDNWTVGYNRNLVVGVWVGNNNGDAMVNTSGLTGAAPIWNAMVNGIYANTNMLASFSNDGQLLPDRPDNPGGVSYREICDVRALQEPATDCSRITELFLDGPAGVPDEAGNLVYAAPTAPPQQPPTGPFLNEVSPGVYQVQVFRLDPNIASQIQFNLQPGQMPPPVPLYCQVPQELASSAGTQLQLFIKPPTFPNDAVAAEEYARSNNLAFLPTIACSPELLVGGGVGSGGSAVQGVAAQITSPSEGQGINGDLQIIGTAAFPTGQGIFYKFQIRGGPFGDWVDFGSTHSDPVTNGYLWENVCAACNGTGGFIIRLLVLDAGGGVLGEDQVTVVIG